MSKRTPGSDLFSVLWRFPESIRLKTANIYDFKKLSVRCFILSVALDKT